MSLRLFKWIKNATFIAVMTLMFISMISFSSDVVKLEFEEIKLQEIEKFVPKFHGFIAVDRSRTLALNKVLTIVRKYNPRLDEVLRGKIAGLIYEMTIKYQNLDIDLICATITHETAFTWRQNIRSPAGAMGLMQLMPYTGRDLSEELGLTWTNKKDILYNPLHNIRLGCRYLSMLIDNYDIDGGLAAYNGGEWRARKWLASGRDHEVLFEETRRYIPAVLALYDSFKD